jgi:hypothetical protein
MSVLHLPEVFSAASLLLAGIGILVLLIGLGMYQRLQLALPLALDFWMAAGLLKLAGFPTWTTIATVAAIVVLRKLVVLQLRFQPKLSMKFFKRS